MEVIVIPTGAMEENCYLIYDPETGNALIIDPGDDAGMISGMVKALRVNVQAILLTHSHFDHIGAVDSLVNEFHVPVYMSREEIDWFHAHGKQDQMFFGALTSLESDLVAIQAGKQKIGQFEVDAILAPGHSAGSTMYLIGENLFSGDVLFQGSIGRTDLPGGNVEQMIQSLALIRNLPGNYTVYPGHGPASTLDYEKTHNPYLAFS